VLIAYTAAGPQELGRWFSINLPRNFIPAISPKDGRVLLRNDEGVVETESNTERIQLIREGKLTIFVNGRIRYRDIFGDEWVQDIDRYWDSGSSQGLTKIFEGKWVSVGDGSRDTHHKVEPSRKEQQEEHV
jgi:hypothetical protein